MTKIEILVFFHLLGAFLICGGAGVGMASGIAMGRTNSVRAIGLLSQTAHRAAFVVTLPGALIVLGTGTWLIADFPVFEIKEFWLWASYVLWGASAGLDHGVLGPFLQGLHRRAQALEEAGTLSSDELRIAADAPLGKVVGMVLLAMLGVALYLMVFRTGT